MPSCKSAFPCLAVLLLIAPAVRAQTPDWDQALAGIRSRAEALERALPSAAYTAESESRQLSADGKLEKTVISVRQVRFTQPDQYQQEYTFMSINGKELDDKERAAELARMKSERGESPFVPSEMSKYRFSDGGEAEYAGRRVIKVDFEPLVPDSKLVRGFGYVLPETYDLAFLSFTPSRLPAGLQAMQAAMDYRPMQGWWLPSAFHLELHIKVAFIFTLADLHVQVDEKYSDYQLPLPEEKK
ncbi:MAG: hypothetical protein AB1439_01445 [candidate division FCPU426 bacterium]